MTHCRYLVSLVYYLQLCVTLCPAHTCVPLYRFLLSLLEPVVMVLISQALCYLSHPDLDDGDKELLKQELASELVS